jgi:RNA-directed DNA polymerase
MWIRKKYFKTASSIGPFLEEKAKEKPRKAELAKLSAIPIVRHRMIKGEANPYDNSWKEYFEQRQAKEWESNPKNKGYVKEIWRQQKGKCPVCQQPIELDRQRDKHHIKPRKEGGKDRVKNMIMLHPTCHRQLHSNTKVVHSVKTMMECKVA